MKEFKNISQGIHLHLFISQEHLDYELVQSTNPEFNKAVVRVNVFREHRQTIQVSTEEHSETGLPFLYVASSTGRRYMYKFVVLENCNSRNCFAAKFSNGLDYATVYSVFIGHFLVFDPLEKISDVLQSCQPSQRRVLYVISSCRLSFHVYVALNLCIKA